MKLLERVVRQRHRVPPARGIHFENWHYMRVVKALHCLDLRLKRCAARRPISPNLDCRDASGLAVHTHEDPGHAALPHETS